MYGGEITASTPPLLDVTKPVAPTITRAGRLRLVITVVNSNLSQPAVKKIANQKILPIRNPLIEPYYLGTRPS